MIRTFQNADLDKVAEIWLETNMDAHDFIPAQYWKGHFTAVKEMLPQAEIYVYEDGESHEIQGFIGLSGIYIAGLFVCGGAQSKGIGKRLLDFVKEGRTGLELRVYVKNSRAVRFYQREHFTVHSTDVDRDTREREYSMVWRR